MIQLGYLAPLALFVPAYAAMLVGGWTTWFLPVFVFVALPLAEQPFRGTSVNPDDDEERARLDSRLYDAIVYAVVPLQLGLLAAFLWRLATGGLAAWELAGVLTTMGIACGAFGINVGHELGHRRSPLARNAAKILLWTSLYQHFFVEHNRGHHRRVATPDDPATARRGESVYAFWVRSIVGSWRHAWALENARLERAGTPWWSWDNAMVRFSVYQGGGLAAIAVGLGPLPAIGMCVAALGGALLLETVNYLEHYGLMREQRDHGGYERVRPAHSWTSNRPIGRMMLFDLTRHADHHAHATRPYQVLRHFDDAPELPAGYPAMIVVALIPPLFHAVMERELRAWASREAPREAA